MRPELKPFFSVVMPSYLGDYENAASQRPEKFRRAVDSVLGQRFMSWELVIVADGCEETKAIYLKEYAGSTRISCIPIPKEPLWSTAVRNWGIRNAQGEYVVYLDTDDYLGPEHLATIHQGLVDKGMPAWAYFNDFYWIPANGMHVERICDPAQKFHHGTSNFTHKRSEGILWPADKTYLHDARFAQQLRSKGPGVRIPAGRYMVCHDPGKFDI